MQKGEELARRLCADPDIAAGLKPEEWDLLERRHWQRVLHAQPELEVYRSITFSTSRELLNRACADGACGPGLVWLEEQIERKGASLEDVLKTIPLQYRIWCISERYDQFKELCRWHELTEQNWEWLLKYRPSMAVHRKGA